MSDAGDIEVENVSLDILPKDVAKDVGTVKLFGRWDYDVEVRDISLTYEETSPLDLGKELGRLDNWLTLDMQGLHLPPQPRLCHALLGQVCLEALPEGQLPHH